MAMVIIKNLEKLILQNRLQNRIKILTSKKV